MRTTRRSGMSPAARTLNYWLSGLLLALTAALILEGAFGLNLILAWLIGINLFTLVFYGIDKLNSIWVDDNKQREALNMRVPEWALLLLALVGGSLGAALAIVVLSHKIDKGSFLLRFFLILAIQGILVYLLWDELAEFVGPL